MKPNYYYANDYAGLETDNCKFYYGYEVEKCDICGNINFVSKKCACDSENTEWCFSAILPDMDRIIIPFSKLGVKDSFEVVECLMMGIGWILTKYKIDLEGA